MKQKKRIVIVNKYRFITFLSIVFILIILIFNSLTNLNTVYSKNYDEYYKIRVVPGDTIWSLANKYSKNKDIRRLVYNIKILNNLDESTIYPGDIILIPID